ncbi:DUF4013 domain-containing protein [Methanobrevibacter sp.]
MYPINNIKALLIYIVLSIIISVVLIITGVGVIGALGTSGAVSGGFGVVGIIGIIVALLISLLIEGFMLDVVKIGINRGDDAPEIDFARQIINGIKYIILTVIYMIIPLLVMFLFSQIDGVLGLILGVILIIIFTFGLLIGVCRLAKTESLGYALNFVEVFKEVTQIGIGKILIIIIMLLVLSIIIGIIASALTSLGDVGSFIGGIISGIANIYLLFFYNRAIGLTYSDM